MRRSRNKVPFIPLTRYQIFVSSYGQQQRILPASGTPQCLYFTTERFSGGSTQSTVPTLTLNCNFHLAKLADILWNSTPGNSMNMATANDPTLNTDITSRIQCHSHVKYTLRAATGQSQSFTMYVCKARGNINIQNFTSGSTNPISTQNVYDILAEGFAQNGLNPANSGATNNVEMRTQQWSPFQSRSFCEDFKIVKTKNFMISGGAQKSFSLKTKPFLFTPKKLFHVFGTGTPTSFSACNPVFNNNKFERFILFRSNSRIMGTGNVLNIGWSNEISNSTDLTQMLSVFTYGVRSMKQHRTPYATFDGIIGFTTADADPTIINEETNELDTVLTTVAT